MNLLPGNVATLALLTLLADAHSRLPRSAPVPARADTIGVRICAGGDITLGTNLGARSSTADFPDTGTRIDPVTGEVLRPGLRLPADEPRRPRSFPFSKSGRAPVPTSAPK